MSAITDLLKTINLVDTDPAAHELKIKIAYAKPRRRQAAPTRFAAAIDELCSASRQLRVQVEQCEPQAIRSCVALLAGVSDRALAGITVCDAPRPDSGVIHIDARAGAMWTDLGRLELRRAAQPLRADQVLPSSHRVPKPIPAWLTEKIAAAQQAWGELVGFDTLFPAAPQPRGTPLVEGEFVGRMRPTLPRLQAGLSNLLLAQGINELTAAFALNDFALVPRSRLFYVAAQARDIWLACEGLYSQLGWSDSMAPAVNRTVGSKVVPTDAAPIVAWTHLRTQAESRLPARRWNLASVIEHHNAYVKAVAWFVAFLIGARESKVLPLSAAACRPGALYVIYGDKRTGPFGSPRPALFCPTAQRQVHLYYSHLRVLATRGEHAANGSRWLRHVQEILAGSDVSLLFLIKGNSVVPLGTADFMEALPREVSLAPNFGRHYWQTSLHRAGLSSQVIDFYARHVTRGTESMTSTTLMPLMTAHELVSSVQEAELRRLGLSPLAGQGQRSRA